MSSKCRDSYEKLRDFALGLPEAFEDHPWGENVVKVNKKVFVFFGLPESLDERLLLVVKLPRTGEYALDMPFVKPSGYGLGKHGWVNIQLGPDDDLPMDLLLEWVEESYRAVAPKRLVARLEETRSEDDLYS